MIRLTSFFTILLILTSFASADLMERTIANFANEDAVVRISAVDAAAKAGIAATDSLIAALDSGDTLVRMGALLALARIADPKAQNLVTTVLKEDAEPMVRGTAAKAVAAYRTLETLETLRLAASDDPDDFVRTSAAIAIASVRSKPAVDLLVWLLKSPSERVQNVAAQALKDITLRNYGTSYEEWRKWWLDNRAAFTMTMATTPFLPVEEEIGQ